MKNKYSSRRVFIPWIIVVIIVSVLISSFFFNRLQTTFKERQHRDAYVHLEDYASTVSEVIRYNFDKNWYTLEIVKNFCENYEGTDFSRLQKFLKSKKDEWSNNRITLITESGRLYNENAENVIRPRVAKNVANIAELGKNYSSDGSNLDYILNVDTQITINGEKIIAVSTAITFNSVIDFNNTREFESKGYLSLINNNGTKFAEQPNPKILFPNNIFSSLITIHGTLITLYWFLSFSKCRISYTWAVTLGFAAAIRWAATTRSGHIVQESVTRIFISVLFVMAAICSRVASSSTCPGPAALYSPNTKEVNS